MGFIMFDKRDKGEEGERERSCVSYLFFQL